jgi:orotate phosphoribosyltransferase
MNWEKRLLEEKVIWRYPGRGPHAVFTLANKHSNAYFNSDYLISQPSLLEEACSDLYKVVRSKITSKPDWVISYAPYGLNVAFCLAKLFACRFGYTRPDNGNEITFDLKANDKVLLCADDLYTGQSVLKTISALTTREVQIIGPLVVLGNFSGSSKFKGNDIVSLVDFSIDIWESTHCPLCTAGSPALSARKYWHDLCNNGQPV